MKKFKIVFFMLLLASFAHATISAPDLASLGIPNNAIGNGGCERGTTGFGRYANTAGTAPVDGAGGSPSVTLGTTTTNPLQGVTSCTFTKGASNLQGNGFNYNFSIALGDAKSARIQQIKFQYAVTSGTFTFGSPSADSDLEVWIYDVTNSQLIQPNAYRLDGSGTFLGTFQPNTNSTSYRLIFHEALTGTAAYTLAVDNVTVAPQVTASAPAMTDSVTTSTLFTPVSFGTITNNSFSYARVGDKIRVQGNFSTGTTTSGVASITLPFAIDTTKLPAANTQVGWAIISTNSSAPLSSTANSIEALIYDGSTSGSVFFAAHTSSAALQKENASSIANSNTAIYVQFDYPVAGWSSNVASYGDQGRAIGMKVAGSSSSITSGGNPIVFTTIQYDPASTYNTSTGTFTAPISGYYKFYGFYLTGNVNWVQNDRVRIDLYHNGSDDSTIGWRSFDAATTYFAEVPYSGSLQMKAGDTAQLYGYSTQSTLGDGYTQDAQLTIERLSGAPLVQAGESISARYTSTSTGTISNGATGTHLYTTLVWDDHGIMNTSTSTITCPVAGKYRFGVSAAYTQSTSTAGLTWYTALWKNGSFEQYIGQGLTRPSASEVQLVTSGETSCVAGDTFQIRVENDTGNTLTQDGNAGDNWITVDRIAN